MHTIVERKAKPADFAFSVGAGKLEPAVLGCAIFGFGLLPAALFGVIGMNNFGRWGLVGGLMLGALLFCAVMLVSRKQREEKREFEKNGEVQEITVQDTTCFEIDLHNSEPIYAFDIGLDKILILQGQWLMDVEIYGSNNVHDDPHDAFVNGLQPPNAFPNKQFSIVRNPMNGEVFAIRPLGEYLPPVTLDSTLHANKLLPQSQLISGTAENLLDDILRGTDLYIDA